MGHISHGGLRELAVCGDSHAVARIGSGGDALLRDLVAVISARGGEANSGASRALVVLLAQLLLLAVPVPLVDLLALEIEELCQVLDQVHRPVGVLLEARLQQFFLLRCHATARLRLHVHLRQLDVLRRQIIAAKMLLLQKLQIN